MHRRCGGVDVLHAVVVGPQRAHSRRRPESATAKETEVRATGEPPGWWGAGNRPVLGASGCNGRPIGRGSIPCRRVPSGQAGGRQLVARPWQRRGRRRPAPNVAATTRTGQAHENRCNQGTQPRRRLPSLCAGQAATASQSEAEAGQRAGPQGAITSTSPGQERAISRYLPPTAKARASDLTGGGRSGSEQAGQGTAPPGDPGAGLCH